MARLWSATQDVQVTGMKQGDDEYICALLFEQRRLCDALLMFGALL